MGTIYKNTHNYVAELDPTSVIIEIGSERGEGSTLYFANLAQLHGIKLHTVDILDSAQSKIDHPDIIWHTAIGSKWSQQLYPTIGKKISVMYLDNFDYLWDNYKTDSTAKSIWNKEIYNSLKGADWPSEYVEYEQLPLRFQNEINQSFGISYDSMMIDMRKQYSRFGFNLTNSECQLEHFKQIFYLHTWLADDCVVVFDETFRYNDCWVGKNGPGVLLLETLGFRIVEEDTRGELGHGVILKRGK
jgi:hypothetical protein